MNYTKQLNLTEFEFWSGAKNHYFTYAELNLIECTLEDFYHDREPSETDINDLFWFEEEEICDWIGLDYNEYLKR